MRTLLLTRGAPGCGKSTWIKANNLEQYTLCPDSLRLLCSSPALTAEGTFSMTPNFEVEQQTWKMLFQLLEFRMSRGEFTVIDATCSKTKDIQKYKEIADQYRYRIFCVDFTEVPLETCLKQNKMRPEWKWVPDEAIENIYARFATQSIPTGVTVIKPDEFNRVLETPFDLSMYEKIVFIGDIHGTYTTLMQYFKQGISENVAYIFLGDYIDRGNENAETIKFLSSLLDNKNVCLLEGNHERSLRYYGNSILSNSKEFENKTKAQLIESNFSERDARIFYRKLRQMSHFTYNGLEILACHGGIPNLSKNLLYIPTRDFTNGTGEYKQSKTIAETWMRDTANNAYLIHGHRNLEKDEVQIADRVFNLEGGVERGGELRIVELNKDLTWQIIELKDCQPITKDLETAHRSVETVEEAISYLRNNEQIQEKQLGGGISSFNFTREAFYNKNWNMQTILARGLFLDTINNKIMARSYEKFFKIHETRETALNVLRQKLVFPVTAWVKENGYLGIVSYDYNKNDLFVATKSTTQGDYAEWLHAALTPYKEKLLAKLRYWHDCGTPVSLVFEVIEKDRDPHIIKYDENKVVLLDVIYNELSFEKIEYAALVNIATQIGCPVKERAYVLDDWDAFISLYYELQEDDYRYNGDYIEGFVFEDAEGFMVKAKTGFYNLWKKLRGVSDQTLRNGYIVKTGMLTSSFENYFYGFCKTLYIQDRDVESKEYPYKTDIISIRDKFYNQ